MIIGLFLIGFTFREFLLYLLGYFVYEINTISVSLEKLIVVMLCAIIIFRECQLLSGMQLLVNLLGLLFN